MHKLKYTHECLIACLSMLQNLGLSLMETMQESAAPMSPMLNDD